MSNENPYGAFSAAGRSHVVLAGTDQDATREARNFGRTRTGEVQTSGSGLKPTGLRLARSRGGGERLFGRNGEINASDKGELIEKIGMLLEGYQPSQGADRLFERQATAEYQEVQAARAQALREAQADQTGAGWMVIGEVLGDEVYETLGREGFGRNTMMVRNLEDKEVGRVKIRKKDVSATVSTTNINTTKVMARQFYVYPGEYYIKGCVSMEEKEISQAGSEIMDDKYQDLLEQVLVVEDQVIKGHWDDSVGIFNPELFFNTFTPLFFSQGCISIDHWGLPCTRAVMSWDLWNDIRAEPEFSNWFDPVTKHSLIWEGKLGSLMDVQLITDGFRYDTLRVLNDGEIYFLGPQIAVGVITQRRTLETRPTDRYNFGQAERGWFVFQIQGTVTFPRAISKASRLGV